MEIIVHLGRLAAAFPAAASVLIILIALLCILVVETIQAGPDGARDMLLAFREHPFGSLVLAMMAFCIVFSGIIGLMSFWSLLQALACGR